MPESYRNRDELKDRVCNPYWMQHLVHAQGSRTAWQRNKVGSPVSTAGRLKMNYQGGVVNPARGDELLLGDFGTGGNWTVREKCGGREQGRGRLEQLSGKTPVAS